MAGRDLFLTGIFAIAAHCSIASGSRWGDEGKEAMNGGKSTVARADGHLPVLLQIIEEREHLADLQVRQGQLSDLPSPTAGDRLKEHLPSVAI
jgi:hypothetical protein